MTKYIPFIKGNEVWVREWIGEEPIPINITGRERSRLEIKNQIKQSNAPTYPVHPDHVEWFKERLGVPMEVELVTETKGCYNQAKKWIDTKYTYAIPKEEKDLWEEAEREAFKYANTKRKIDDDENDYADNLLSYFKQHYTLTKK